MGSIETIFLFLFVFSIITITKVMLQFLILIKNDQPRTLQFKKVELILYGIALSYIITYMIEKI
jgi:hypothetical protein